MTQPREKKPRKTRPPKNPNLRNKMYKFRLYPTQKQAATLEWTLRRCRELYNAALEERMAAYKMRGVLVNYAMQCAQLPDIKAERTEYQEIYSQVQQDVLKRIDKAMVAFFRRVREGQNSGYPRFKSNSRYHSFTYRKCPTGACVLVWRGAYPVKAHSAVSASQNGTSNAGQQKIRPNIKD
jgi:putative transposase